MTRVAEATRRLEVAPPGKKLQRQFELSQAVLADLKRAASRNDRTAAARRRKGREQ